MGTGGRSVWRLWGSGFSPPVNFGVYFLFWEVRCFCFWVSLFTLSCLGLFPDFFLAVWVLSSGLRFDGVGNVAKKT